MAGRSGWDGSRCTFRSAVPLADCDHRAATLTVRAFLIRRDVSVDERPEHAFPASATLNWQSRRTLCRLIWLFDSERPALDPDEHLA